MPIFIGFDGIAGDVQAADRFDFTAPPRDAGLLLPAAPAARDVPAMPDDAQGIIAILIGLVEDGAGRSSGITDKMILELTAPSDGDLAADRRIIAADDWG